MRVSKYIRDELKHASDISFKDAKLFLFGSRLDDNKRGGDFDIAVKCNVDRETFRKSKIKFFKYLLLKDLELPIDLVHYEKANALLKSEIDKGVII
jgi:predicted nucleotidyltransferase